MIVYEKDNKLNINFENQLDNPDIEIGKSEIKVDGNNIVSGGSSAPLVVTFSGTTAGGDAACDKTWAEIVAAENLVFRYAVAQDNGTQYYYLNIIDNSSNASGAMQGVSGQVTFLVTDALLGDKIEKYECHILNNSMVLCIHTSKSLGSK